MKKILPVITISFLAGALTSFGTFYVSSNYMLDKISQINNHKNISNFKIKKLNKDNINKQIIKKVNIEENKDNNELNNSKGNLDINKNKLLLKDNSFSLNNEENNNEAKEEINNSTKLEIKDEKPLIENTKEDNNEIINNLPLEERENATKVANEVKESAEKNYKKEAFSLISNKVKSFAIPYLSYDSNPKADIIIFASYKCPFCHKLFNDLDRIRYKGYNIYILPIPKNGLNSEEEDNLINLECLDNNQKPEAFINMFNGSMPKKYEGNNLNSCKLNIERFYDLAMKMGADGTPFAFTNEGSYTMSYKDIDSFLNNLNLK